MKLVVIPPRTAESGLRLLIFNWRDPLNPRAGGAETFTFEVARRLVAGGDAVEWFTAGFDDAAPDQNIDGVRILRVGRQWSVHWHAFSRYRGRLPGRFDAVIDEVNTMPFFTPLWAGIPTFMLIFQLAREVWWYESRFPINAIGYAAEPFYLRAYRQVPVFTISASTEQDLRRLGFEGPITTVPVGVETVTQPMGPKETMPTFLYVGRLAPSKRITDIVRAVARFREAMGTVRLWLVGDGPVRYTTALRRLVDRLALTGNVRFLGRVSPAEKHRLMGKAHMLLMTSVREGWGLVVTEANACGTPAVVYDVPGLRDAVQHEETGLVVQDSPSDLAAGMRRLWDDAGLYGRLAAEARRRSCRYSFDKTTATIRETIARSLAR